MTNVFGVKRSTPKYRLETYNNQLHEKWREAPPGGRLTMMSCLVGNKTSLSRIPSIADNKLLWSTIMKSWLLSNFYKQQILI